MTDEFITLKTAELAVNKGCTLNIYGGQNEILVMTQPLLQKWLRETKDLHLSINKLKGLGYKYVIRKEDSEGDYKCIKTKVNHLWSYEEALEIGLQEALKLI